MAEILVFFGHDFFGKERDRKTAYREAVQQACERANQEPQILAQGLRLAIVYGDTSHLECRPLFDRISTRRSFPLDGRYWNEIRAKLDACDYAIFDLSYRSTRARFLNANVL